MVLGVISFALEGCRPYIFWPTYNIALVLVDLSMSLWCLSIVLIDANNESTNWW